MMGMTLRWNANTVVRKLALYFLAQNFKCSGELEFAVTGCEEVGTNWCRITYISFRRVAM
jgi:hypothetical protein